jgi:hypothetical protein
MTSRPKLAVNELGADTNALVKGEKQEIPFQEV